MFTKFLHPKTLREAVRSGAIAAVGLVAGTWIIALLTQFKWFENPRHQVSEVAHFFAWLTVQGWFLLLTGLVLGFGAGAWLDAYLVRRTGKLWWHHIQAFTIRDSACLLAAIKRSEFEKSDRALAIANELRGYVNSGHVPLFLEMEFEKPFPDLSDPKARYEPPYDKKDVSFDAVIPKRCVEYMARGRSWPLPWSLPPVEEGDTFPRPLRRPKPVPHSSVPTVLSLGKAMGMFAAGAEESNKPTSEGETK
jgi:hypothetical protein